MRKSEGLTSPSSCTVPSREAAYEAAYYSSHRRHSVATRPRVFTYGALRELLALHGFRVVAVAGLSTLEALDWQSPPLALALLNPLDRPMIRLPAMTSNLVIASEKTERRLGRGRRGRTEYRCSSGPGANTS